MSGFSVSTGVFAQPATDITVGGPPGDNATYAVPVGVTTNNRQAVLGAQAGATGTVTVAGPSTVWALSTTAAGQYPLLVGRRGSGTLIIKDGGKVSSSSPFAGYFNEVASSTGSTGSMVVEGAGSNFTSNANLAIGYSGVGSLRISGGAVVSTASGVVGLDAGSAGSTAIVTGAGSTWNASALLVGQFGDAGGRLDVLDGGKVASRGVAVIALQSGSSGILNVDGAGSRVTAGGNLAVGDGGVGQLNVTRGASVQTTKAASLGASTTGNGSATIDGQGSLWDVVGNLTVGGAGKGTLSVSNAAQVRSATTIIGDSTGSTATLNISGAADARGILSTGQLTAGTAPTGKAFRDVTFDNGVLQATADRPDFIQGFGAGELQIMSGGLMLDTNGHTVGANSTLSGAGGLVKVGEGTLVLRADNTYAGPTHIASGTLQLGDGGTQGSIQSANLQNDGVLVFKRSDAVNFPGAITGAGSVTQAGSGTTTLSAVNAYAGGTTITAGKLVGTASSFGSGDITNNAALVIDQAGDAAAPNTIGGAGKLFKEADVAIMRNAINGNGSLVKEGAGTLIYTGVGSLTGPTSVSAGKLVVNGSLANSAMTVANAATLAGTGTVGSVLITSGGTIAPGDGAIGTLKVNGGFTSKANSNFQVQVDSSTKGVSSRVSATGDVAIEDGSVLTVSRTSTAPYMLDSKYTVLSTTGQVSGKFSLAGDTRTAFVQIGDTYDQSNVYLTASQVRSFVTAATTVNQTATSAALDGLSSGSVLRNEVAFLPNDVVARQAFDRLSGEVHGSMRRSMVEDSRFVREAAIARLADWSCGLDDPDLGPTGQREPVSSSWERCPSTQHTVWAQAFGSTGKFHADGNSQGMRRSLSGILVGADTPLAEGWRAGALVGYGRTSSDAGNDQGNIDNIHLGVYGGKRWGALGLRLGANYTKHSIETQRRVSFGDYFDALNAKYDGSSTQVFGEIGYAMKINDGFAVEPFAGLAYANTKTNAFSESGNAAALNVGKASQKTTFSTLGARLHSHLNSTTTFTGMIGWRRAYGDVLAASASAFRGGQPFAVYGTPLAKDTAIVEASIEIAVTPALTVGAAYSGQFAKRLRDNGAKAYLNYKF
ncbi:autotransporter domain-containing protein [Variovorax sp. TBS-050B]|uniref:autotransporter domain-containing protein n=1 Tax=Variovorax sp. TBS-050B TaxID=2940551 RepID=UPI002473A087|nr:autotransporter domain-containing protein [Variovorax sp. TBS-050B]